MCAKDVKHVKSLLKQQINWNKINQNVKTLIGVNIHRNNINRELFKLMLL